jgi:Uma2 family endonuclease
MSTAPMENKLPRHPITAEEYHRMAEIGRFAPDARVELIEGEIIEMAPIGIQHCSAVDRLTHGLVTAVGAQAIVRVGGSFRLSNITEPQPDLILLRPREDFYSSRVATGDDTLLVIEVSDNTLRFDRKVKVPLYARHRIPEVWIVDLENGRLQFFRSREDDNYADISFATELGIVPLPGLSGLTVDLGSLLKT